MKIIVKYGNRKLYDKETSKYTTLAELLKLPLGSFRVVLHDQGEDVTTQTLLNALMATTDSETKIKVMQHCIVELSN